MLGRPRPSPRRLLPARLLAAVTAALLALAVGACAPSAEKQLGRATPEVPFPSPSAPATETPTAPATPTSPSDPTCPTPPSGGGGGGGGGEGGGSQLSGPLEPRYEPASAPSTKNRPTLWLCFAFSSDLTEASGQEQVSFTPDRKVCELVFRLWPNKPQSAADGSELTIDAAQVDGEDVEPAINRAGAPKGKTGTLATLPLKACAEAGTEIEIGLSFSLKLGEGSTERVGYDPKAEVAWAGSAFPLLAWQPGKGWAKDPAVDLVGEMTTSPVFTIQELRVVAASGMKVAGTGTETESSDENGFTTHVFASDAVRDVAVTVGRLSITDFEVEGVKVHLAEPTVGSQAGTQAWTNAVSVVLPALTQRLGNVPYGDLWLSVVPSQITGIEYPGAVLFGDAGEESLDLLIAHELAHQWFYALVGNNQAQDPWLDESFAQYATVNVLGEQGRYLGMSFPAKVRDRVGESMAFYAKLGSTDLYAAGVYDQGAQMLLEVEQAVGSVEMQQILRAYISANANTISTPRAVRKAFASQPQAIKIFTAYGALS